MGKNKKKGGKKLKTMNTWQNKENSLPVIYITFEAKNKLDLYIECCDEEINGLGRVEKTGNKLIINEIILLPQEVTSSSAETDNKALDEFILSEIENGGNVENLKMQWHSHVNMTTFWSEEDKQTIEKFRNLLKTSENHKKPWSIFANLRTLLKSVENLRTLLKTFENFWKRFENIRKRLKTYENVNI